LAKEGYRTTGLNLSTRMMKHAQGKLQELPKLERLVQFKVIRQYQQYFDSVDASFDAVMFLGNALSHEGRSYTEVLQRAVTYLSPKGVIIVQLANFHKILNVTNRFQDFNIVRSKISPNHEYAYIEFYDPPRNNNKDLLTLGTAILIYNGKRWSQSHINSTPVVHITEQIVRKILEKNGFRNIQVYGSEFGEPLFKKKFDKEKHDWVNIVATR